MAKSLDATDVSVVRPTGTVSPQDVSTGPYDNNNSNDPGGLDRGIDNNDFPWW